VRNSEGQTALLLACRNGWLPMVETLILSGDTLSVPVIMLPVQSVSVFYPLSYLLSYQLTKITELVISRLENIDKIPKLNPRITLGIFSDLGIKKVKKADTALHMGTPSQSYGTSLAIWDHAVLPATRHK